MSKTDFFISYNSADESWAEWIAWQLEQAGHTTDFRGWDSGAGGNFVLEMQKAASEANRTVIVLSPDWLSAQLTWAEFSAAFAKDPTGEKRVLVPVRIRTCELPGALRQIGYIDLVGAEEPEARQRLLDGIRLERKKPSASPPFPNTRGPLFPNAKISSVSRDKKHVLNPEFTAAMLDKQRQVTHVMDVVPKGYGKTIGFVLSGPSREWPKAVCDKMAYGLMLAYGKSSNGVPLQGERLESRVTADAFLRRLLAVTLQCDDDSPEGIAAELALPKAEESSRKPRIFYRQLSQQEAQDHRWLCDMLTAWSKLGDHLPSDSPSHFLILINLDDEVPAWPGEMTKILQQFGLPEALMPPLESPKRKEVRDWAFNHLPENIRDDIQEQVEGFFGDHAALPHGELRKHIVQLLKPYVS